MHQFNPKTLATMAYLAATMWNPFVTPYAFSAYPVASPLLTVPTYFGGSAIVGPAHRHYDHIHHAYKMGEAAGAAAQQSGATPSGPSPMQS